MGGIGGSPRAAEKNNNKNDRHKVTHKTLNKPNIPEMRDRLFKLTIKMWGLGFIVFKISKF